MTEFRVTFGRGQALPIDGWLAVEAPDERAARRAVADQIGPWRVLCGPRDLCYPSAVWFPRGELARIRVEGGAP